MKFLSVLMLNKILKDAHNKAAAYSILIREDVRTAARCFFKGAKMSPIHVPVGHDAILRLGLSGHEKALVQPQGVAALCEERGRRRGPSRLLPSAHLSCPCQRNPAKSSDLLGAWKGWSSVLSISTKHLRTRSQNTYFRSHGVDTLGRLGPH